MAQAQTRQEPKAKVWQCYQRQWLKQVLMTPKQLLRPLEPPTLTPDTRGVSLAHYHMCPHATCEHPCSQSKTSPNLLKSLKPIDQNEEATWWYESTANTKHMKVAELEPIAVAVAAVVTGSTWMGAIGGMQIGVRWEQVGQVFSMQVLMTRVFMAWAQAGLVGLGGMSAGVPLADVAWVVLLGAESRAELVSLNVMKVANVVPSGSTSM